MPTVEDMQKALWQKKLENMRKDLEYRNYLHRVELAEKIKIPYKIITEYEPQKGEQFINEFYPENWQTVQTWAEWLHERHPEIPNYAFMTEAKKTEYLEEVRKQPEDEQKKALQEALEKEYQLDQRRFKNEQERQYYFTRFLQGYDIASFSMFDCYGNKNKHTQAEYEQFKAECIRLQADFEAHKEKYFTDYVAERSPITDELERESGLK